MGDLVNRLAKAGVSEDVVGDVMNVHGILKEGEVYLHKLTEALEHTSMARRGHIQERTNTALHILKNMGELRRGVYGRYSLIN